ncbi:MAG: D-alanine--D-alanine ligase, partial [Flavobacteriaceae bacterium]|nr:D-alanine--D-alanine ligase [Flavobacteriaceae bacterium]
MKKNIAVLMGGYSLEHDISIKSGLNVFNSIDKLKFNVFKIIIEKESWYYLDDENQKFEINKKNFSVNDDL